MGVIPFEMGNSRPGHHLQIGGNFNILFRNICVGYVQNFTLIFQVLFELWLFECGHRSRFSASKLTSLYFLPLLTGNNFSSTAHSTMKFAGFTECVMHLWQMN